MATWNVLPTSGRSATSVQAASESAPTLATEGCNLMDVAGFDLYVEADSGQTFTATTGAFYGYKFSDLLNAWYRAPEVDVSIPTGGVGQRRVVFPGWTVSNPRDRIAHVANSIAVSGGGVTVTYICTSLHGSRT